MYIHIYIYIYIFELMLAQARLATSTQTHTHIQTHTQKNDRVASINVVTRSNARCYLVRHALFRCEVERVQRAVSSQHCRHFLFLVFNR